MADVIATVSPAAVTRTPPGKMTYEEFLARAEDGAWAEWVDGEVIVMSPPSDEHQDLRDFLLMLVRFFAESRRAGVARSAPFQMKLGEDQPGREPDLLFVDNDHRDCMRKTHLDGPAQLAVEIISPESRSRDRGDKFYEYERGGVQEYWLIDPIREQAEFYQRDDRGIYQPARIGDDGIFRSGVLEGLWLNVDWLWQRPLPLVLAVLKEWGIV